MTVKSNSHELRESSSLQERVVAKVRAMTLTQRFKLLRAAGIYTKGGKLTARYRS